MKWTILLSLFAFSNASFIRDHYLFENGILTLKTDWVNTTGVWVNTFCPIGTLELPANVDGSPLTSIGQYAFNGCAELNFIVFPETVQSIEKRAFANSGLRQIVFPEGLTSIGDDAFTNTPLNYVTFLGSSVSVSQHGFRGVSPELHYAYYTLDSYEKPNIDNLPCDECFETVLTCNERTDFKLEDGECVCKGEVPALSPAFCCLRGAISPVTCLCNVDEPVHSGGECRSCMETINTYDTASQFELADPDLFGFAQKLVYISEHNRCVCPYIFADKFCNFCPTPDNWEAIVVDDIDDWENGFAGLHGTRGECTFRNPGIGKYFELSRLSYDPWVEVDCPAGTSSLRDLDTANNRIKLSRLLVNDFTLNLDIGEIGTLYKQFLTLFAKLPYSLSETYMVSLFTDYHFYSNVCPVCTEGFSRAGWGGCSASCPDDMFKLVVGVPHMLIEGTMGKCVDQCPPDYVEQGDECVPKPPCDPNHFLENDVCVDCPVGYISDGTGTICHECRFVSQQGTSQQGTACPWTPDVLSQLYRDMNGCADEVDS